MRIAIFTGTRGRGSNMAAIIRATQEGTLVGCAEVALVIAPRADTPAESTARELGVSTRVIDPKVPDYADQLLHSLAEAKIDLICLAGFMSLFPTPVLRAYPQRVLNIHPALLPKYGGKGMYGQHVHRAVAESGDTESGCTVHYVTEQYDEGAPILQLTCPIQPGTPAESIAERVLKLEHQAYPEAIRRVLGCP